MTNIIINIAIFLNILVSVFIARRDDLERFQKLAQIAIVWLIPYLAAIGIWIFYLCNDDDTPSNGEFGGGSSGGTGSAG